jgi:hypothetical protein
VTLDKAIHSRYTQGMNTTATIEAGMTVTAAPVGQKRKQTIYVTDVTDGVVTGLLVSKTNPGDYRGHAVALVEDCEPVA